MTKSKIEFPFLKDSNIEKETLGLLNSYAEERDKEIKAPIDVEDIIEYLDYDIDFRKDDIYEDENILGGLRISNKMVEINDNLSGPQGRRSFTMAHETGHIVLHVPY